MAENKHPEQSPDQLNNSLAGKNQGSSGVRRINRIPLMVGFCSLAIVGAVVLFTLYDKSLNSRGLAAAKLNAATQSAAKLPDSIQNAETSGAIAEQDKTAAPQTDGSADAEPLTDKSTAPRSGTAVTSAMGAKKEMQAQMQAETESRQALSAAREQTAQREASALAAQSSVALQNISNPNRLASGTVAASARDADNPALSAATSATTDDPNSQAEKKLFLTAKSDASDYLPHTRENPMSGLDVKAGTVIPATLISGINSDLPGQIIAQVRENIYDTATGKHLMVPQGSRLIGTYDSGVTHGQTRALTVWKRIIFPDATSLDLDSMVGADQSGFSGFSDDVDNHYWQLLKDALLVSVFSAGIQLSQPQAVNGQNITSTQVASASIGQELGQLGTEYARRDLNVQPTLVVRPGYLFSVMVNKDMVMPVWSDHRNIQANVQ